MSKKEILENLIDVLQKRIAETEDRLVLLKLRKKELDRTIKALKLIIEEKL